MGLLRAADWQRLSGGSAREDRDDLRPPTPSDALRHVSTPLLLLRRIHVLKGRWQGVDSGHLHSHLPTAEDRAHLRDGPVLGELHQEHRAREGQAARSRGERVPVHELRYVQFASHPFPLSLVTALR